MTSKRGKYTPGVKLTHRDGASAKGACNGGSKGGGKVPESSDKLSKLPKGGK